MVKLNLIFQIRNPEIRGSTSTIQPRLEWPAWSVVPCRSRTARKDPDRTDRTCKTQPQLLQDCPWLFSPQVTPITRFVPIVIGCRSWKSIAFGFDRPTIIGKPLRPQQRFVSWSAFGRGIWCWRNFFVKLFACMMGLGPQFLAHLFYLRIHLVCVNYKESNACFVKLTWWFGRTSVTITVRSTIMYSAFWREVVCCHHDSIKHEVILKPLQEGSSTVQGEVQSQIHADIKARLQMFLLLWASWFVERKCLPPCQD